MDGTAPQGHNTTWKLAIEDRDGTALRIFQPEIRRSRNQSVRRGHEERRKMGDGSETGHKDESTLQSPPQKKIRSNF